MYQPSALFKGDKIAIVSPSGKIDYSYIKNASEILANLFFTVSVGKSVCGEHGIFAGKDECRIHDMQEALDDISVKAILCSRGGYGAVRIIEKLNFTRFIKHPKWIIGYSDITVFHAYLNNVLEIESLHATMPINFPFSESNASLDSMLSFIQNKFKNYIVHSQPLNIKGSAEGILVGGNLSILYSLRGSNMDFEPKGKILFIEDIGEQLYHLDRMMYNLKIGGKLENLAGLIVGGFSDMNDSKTSFGKSAQQIIYDIVSEYNYPVVFDFPAGHIDNNMALVMGRTIKLIVDEDNSYVNWKD